MYFTRKIITTFHSFGADIFFNEKRNTYTCRSSRTQTSERGVLPRRGFPHFHAYFNATVVLGRKSSLGSETSSREMEDEEESREEAGGDGLKTLLLLSMAASLRFAVAKVRRFRGHSFFSIKARA